MQQWKTLFKLKQKSECLFSQLSNSQHFLSIKVWRENKDTITLRLWRSLSFRQSRKKPRSIGFLHVWVLQLNKLTLHSDLALNMQKMALSVFTNPTRKCFYTFANRRMWSLCTWD